MSSSHFGCLWTHVRPFYGLTVLSQSSYYESETEPQDGDSKMSKTLFSLSVLHNQLERWLCEQLTVMQCYKCYNSILYKYESAEETVINSVQRREGGNQEFSSKNTLYIWRTKQSNPFVYTTVFNILETSYCVPWISFHYLEFRISIVFKNIYENRYRKHTQVMTTPPWKYVLILLLQI